MKNFTLILFILFILFLLLSLYINDFLLIYLAVCLAFIISFICLIYYMGLLRGIVIGLSFIILPFLLEFIGNKFWPALYPTHLIRELSVKTIEIPITVETLFSLMSLPLLFITGLFFTYKIKNHNNIKKYHRTFFIVVGSLLMSFNFLFITNQSIKFEAFFKWLIIALIINIILSRIYIFEFGVADIYKELPIIIFLAIYGSRALRLVDEFNLVLALVLTAIYLYLLYTEYKTKQLSLKQPILT